MNRRIIVLGGGGHAKVLLDILLSNSITVLGIIDNNPDLSGSSLLGIPILGGDERLSDYAPESVRLVNGIGSVGPTYDRQKLYDQCKNLGFLFESIIHPSSIIARDVTLKEGVQVMAGSILQTGTSIGENTIINTKASVDHDCEIGNHVHLSPGVTLSGEVKIRDGTHIGTGANVVQGIRIGRGSFVGAGSLITHHLPDGANVRTLPAAQKLVRYRKEKPV